jgi:DNA-binding protein HU-beta
VCDLAPSFDQGPSDAFDGTLERGRNQVRRGCAIAGCGAAKKSPFLLTQRLLRRSSHGKGDSNMAKSNTAKKKPLSKSEILQAVTDAIGEEISRKQVKQVVETLVDLGHRELKKNGIFVLPGFAKFVVVKKPARPAREGINPFTKEKQMFAAKPASKGVRARPVKAVKDAVI